MNNSVSAFVSDLKKFIKQAVSGALMNTTNCTINNKSNEWLLNLDSVLIKIYLNMCWHSYGKKNDEYMMQSFDQILSHNMIRGIVCLIHWIDHIGLMMLEKIIGSGFLLEIMNIETNTKRQKINAELSKIYDGMATIIAKINCDGQQCDNDYDGKDFFIIQSSS